MGFKKIVLILFSSIALVIALCISSWFLCFVGFISGLGNLCAPFGMMVDKSEYLGDKLYFYHIQRKVKKQTAEAVDYFLYARMLSKYKKQLENAQKISPNIHKDKLVDFYLQKAIEMGYREAMGSYAEKLASEGTQQFIHGSHDKAHQMYTQALILTEQLIVKGCDINSDMDIWGTFYNYKSRMGKVNARLLDEVGFVRQMIVDDISYEPHHHENIKRATFIYMYDLINCNHVMQRGFGVNDYIPDTYEDFRLHRNEKSRILLYALEIVTGRYLQLPKPTSAQDIIKERALKEKAMVFAREYHNNVKINP